MNLDFLDTFEEPGYVIDVRRCASLTGIPAVITSVFKRILDTGYVSVGDYMRDMSDHDLEILVDLVDRIHPEMSASYSADARVEALELLTLISLGLAMGEGLHLNDENNEYYIKAMIVLIATESLARKGLVNVYRKNWTLGKDDSDKPIADAI